MVETRTARLHRYGSPCNVMAGGNNSLYVLLQSRYHSPIQPQCQLQVQPQERPQRSPLGRGQQICKFIGWAIAPWIVALLPLGQMSRSWAQASPAPSPVIPVNPAPVNPASVNPTLVDTALVDTALVDTALDRPGAEAEDRYLCLADLPAAIAPILQQAEFRQARWGIRVETQARDRALAQELLDIEGDRLLIPASNVKLMTTAAALDALGPEFQIHMQVLQEEIHPGQSELPSVSEGEDLAREDLDLARGDSAISAVSLRIVGRGDPTLTSEDLRALASQMRDRGIRHIQSLMIDDRYFHRDAVNPNWEWEDVQAGYGAPASSFILNGNELRLVAYPGPLGEPVRIEWLDAVNPSQWQIVNRTVTVPATGSGYTWVGRDLSQPIVYVDGQRAVGAPPDESAISVPNPSVYFAEQLVSALAAAEIVVEDVAIASQSAFSDSPRTDSPRNHQTAQLQADADGAHEVARHSSPPLADLLVTTNRDSENIYAESLLRQVGRAAAAGSAVGAADEALAFSSLTAGLQSVSQRLTRVGVTPGSFRLADGSGLSRQNLVSPMALVETLQAMARHPQAMLYRESLAIAGRTGTLQYRLQDTPAAGRLHGKSGGLTGIASLSGYLDPPRFEPLVFSIILNHSLQSGRSNRAAIDDIVLQLARLQVCQE